MPDTAIHEMISAFAAGCMDEKNYLYFKEHIEEKGRLADKELGELQNIMALLPLLLDKEPVPPGLKKKVAKKLISLQPEIKSILKTRTEQRTAEREADIFKNEEKFVSPEPVKPVLTEKEVVEDDLPVNEPVNKPKEKLQDKLERRKFMSMQHRELVLTRNHWLGIVALLTILVAIITGMFLMYRTLDRKIESLTVNMEAKTSEVELNTGFRENYFSLMQFFNNADLKYYRLESPVPNTEAVAKLFLSISGQSGFLKFDNVPMLAEEQTYQLWLRTPTRDYSLGTYLPDPGKQLTEITSVPAIGEETIEKIFVTTELVPGTGTPQGRIIMESKQ